MHLLTTQRKERGNGDPHYSQHDDDFRWTDVYRSSRVYRTIFLAIIKTTDNYFNSECTMFTDYQCNCNDSKKSVSFFLLHIGKLGQLPVGESQSTGQDTSRVPINNWGNQSQIRAVTAQFEKSREPRDAFVSTERETDRKSVSCAAAASQCISDIAANAAYFRRCCVCCVCCACCVFMINTRQ